jgi:hypothetical protein
MFMMLIPISLPGDDFELIANCLSSLETRTDLSWRIFDETKIGRTTAAASRSRQAEGIDHEPHSIKSRLKALADHWHSFAVLPTRPERWDEESNTTFIPPLINNLSFEDHKETALKNDIFKLSLTTEQSTEADKIYQKWLKSYKREAAYFKDHPPRPIGWVAIPKLDLSVRNGWVRLLHDNAALSSVTSRLAEDKAYKPIHEACLIPPVSWRVPGEVDQRTEEERKHQRDAAKLVWAKRNAREDSQEDYLRNFRAQQSQTRA